MASNKECISLKLDSCQFKVTPNQKANGDEPIYEISAFSQVGQHSALIDRVARETNVDARLIRAIMYMETTHGYYDMPLSLVGMNKSILPMNINIKYWGKHLALEEISKSLMKTSKRVQKF